MPAVSCPHCQFEVPSEARFCPNCGRELPAVDASQPPAPTEIPKSEAETGVCPRCGHVHAEPYPLHCHACGYPLEQPSGRSQKYPSAETHPSDFPVSPPKRPGAIASAEGRRFPRGLLRFLGVFALVAVLVIVGGVVICWLTGCGSGGVSIEPCEPLEPGEEFEAANLRDLDGKLRSDTYFVAGEEYTIAEGATLSVPSDATLIIEPGARIRFGEGSRLVVEGNLQACGRRSRPILFTADASTGRPGYWYGIEIRNADPETVIGHATIEFAGKDNHAPIWIEGTDLQLEDLSFESNQWYPMSLSADSFPEVEQSFDVENGPRGWEIRGGVLNQDRDWPANELGYVINGTFEVGEGASLSIPAGTWVKFLPASGLQVKGSLLAVGEPSDHIVFTSAYEGAEGAAPDPKAGDWAGIQVFGQPGETLLEYVDIRYAGGVTQLTGCLWLSEASPILQNVEVTDCAAFSLSTDIASNPSFDNLKFDESDPTRWWEMRESSLSGNVSRRLEAQQSSESQIPLRPMITGWIVVEEDATLGIGPGMTLLFREGEKSGIWVGGSLEIDGSKDQPVVMTSWLDQEFGGSGGAAPGDWKALILQDNSPGESRIEHLEIRYGGAGKLKDNGCLMLANASPAVSDMTVTKCAAYPVSGDALSDPILSGIELGNNLFANQWEIRSSNLKERREWRLNPMASRGGKPIFRTVTGQIFVDQEARLTLGPGVVLGFAPEGFLNVRGGLTTEGTADQPVLLTSWQDPIAGGKGSGALPGDWRGVLIEGSSSTSNLNYSEIRYAGSERHGLSCLTIISASPTLTNVTLTNCLNYPIRTDLTSEPTVIGLVLSDNLPSDDWALRESTLESGNERTWSSLQDADGRTIGRLVLGQLWVKEGATLRIDPGVFLKFVKNARLRINGSIRADGSDQAPIIMTSWRDPEFSGVGGSEAGDWLGVFLENTNRGNRLQSTEIRYAGGGRPDGALVLVNSSVELIELTIRDPHSYPISLDAGSNMTLESATFDGQSVMKGVEIRASSLNLPGETVWAPWLDAGGEELVRVVTGDVTVGDQATLRLDPGTVLKFGSNGGLTIRGSLIAIDAVLTSVHDDEYGGETDGGTDGDRKWKGIRIVGSRLSRLVGSLIRYAQTGLWLEDASLVMENTRVEDNVEAAISADGRSELSGAGIRLAGNGVNGMVVRDQTLATGTTHWNVIGSQEGQIVRVLDENLRIGPGSRLTVGPGVVVKFALNAGLVVEGKLEAGRVDGPAVAFTSLADDSIGGETDRSSEAPRRGGWSGIIVNPNRTDAQISLVNAEIRYAVNGLYLVEMPEWQHEALVISESQFYGISCDASSQFLRGDPYLIFLNNGAETLACPTPDRTESP